MDMKNFASSDLFSIYLDQFNTCMQRNKKLLESLNFNLKEDDYSKLVLDIEKNFKEAGRIVSQMNLDINLTGGKPGSKNDTVNKKQAFINCRKELDEVNLLFRKEKENYHLKKKAEELILRVDVIKDSKLKSDQSWNNKSKNSDFDDDMTILSVGSQSNQKLSQIIRTGIETEKISENVLKELHGHSMKIGDINSKVQLLTGSLNNSNSIVRNMLARGNRNKAILAVFSFTLVCMFILVLFSRSG